MKKPLTFLIFLLAYYVSFSQNGTVTDIDGNVYQTVVIGEQEWMVENLRVSRYQNGELIPEGPHQNNYFPQQHFYFYYGNNFSNIADYGLLYTGYVVVDNREVCPAGWTIPSYDQWKVLEEYVGMMWQTTNNYGMWNGDDEGGKLKIPGTEYWLLPNVGATDQENFAVMPGGMRNYNFSNIQTDAYFWTSSNKGDDEIIYKRYNYNTSKTYTQSGSYGQAKSIRCIRIQDNQSLPTIDNQEVLTTGATSAEIEVNVVDDGNATIIARGVCYGKDPEPTVDYYKGFSLTNDGTGPGSFTSQLIDLEPNQAYYARPYAVNAKGISYGQQISFQTINADIPGLGYTYFEDLESNSVRLFSDVSHQGESSVTSRGFVWSRASNPTLQDNYAEVGSGSGQFNMLVTGLVSNATYYFKAYATNDQGTRYSEQGVFHTTPDNIPVLSTPSVSNIGQNSAMIQAAIETDGGHAILDWGIIYSFLGGESIVISFGTDDYEINIELTDLESNKEYTIQTYAINDNGRVYSETTGFKTLFANTGQMLSLLNEVYRHLYLFGPGEGQPYGYGNHDNFGVKSHDLTNDLMGADMVVHSAGYGWFNANYRYTSHANKNSGLTRYTWARFYFIIDQINYILENIDQAEGFQPTKDKIKGQLLALRAFCHFHLVQVFSHPFSYDPESTGIPYQTASIDIYSKQDQEIIKEHYKQADNLVSLDKHHLVNNYGEKNSFPGLGTGIIELGTVANVYSHLINDLSHAISLLENSGDQDHPSHISLPAVHGIRARVALAMEDFSAASYHAQAAIDEFGSQNLFSVDDYPEEFELIYQNGAVTGYDFTAMSGFNDASLSSEWMWGSVIAAENATVYASFWSHMDPRFMSYASLGTQKKITLSLYDQIPESDGRKNLWVPPDLSFSGSYGGYGADIPPLCQMKFLVPQIGQWRGDYVYMRLAEMFLIKAEAQARHGDYAAGSQTLYDLISTRDPEYQQPTKTGEALLEEILLHRRIELWGEGHSYTDLRRLQLPLDRPSGTGNHDPDMAYILELPANDDLFLWQIPFFNYFTIEIDGNGEVEINGELYSAPLYIAMETEINIKPLSEPGWYLSHWSINGDLFSESYSLDFIMPDENVTITAHFMEGITIRASSHPIEGGTINGQTEFIAGYQPDDVVTLVAVANEDFNFIKWTEDGTEIPGAGAIYAFIADTDRNLIANFRQSEFMLTLFSNPEEGGTVSGQGNYEPGEQIDVSASPTEGWYFVEWTGDIEHVGNSHSAFTTVTMPDADITLTAQFEEGPCLPDWTPVENLQFNMNILANILFDDEISLNPDDMVGAFIDGECRGVASPQPENDGLVFLTVSSNVQYGETVELIIWNSELCETCETYQTVEFENLSQIGTIANPYEINCYTLYELLLDFGLGFTWFSVNVVPQSMMVNDLFADLSPCENDRIIGQTQMTSYSGDEWIGNLTYIDQLQSYVMQLCSQQSLYLIGLPAEIEPMSLSSGFTWLGYLPQECLPVNTALATIGEHATANDRIIGQSSFASFSGTQWLGSLTHLCPGDGYVIDLAQDATLMYPDDLSKVVPIAKQAPFLKSPIGVYPTSNLRYNMTLLANLLTDNNEISHNENDVIYAFAGDECRGIAYPTTSHEGTIFMSIGSDDMMGEIIHFKVWLDDMQQLVHIHQTIQFESLKAYGSFETPFILTTGEPLGDDDLYTDEIFVGDPYPNPFTKQTEIPYLINEPAEVSLSVFNSTGQLVYNIKEYHDTPGNYVLSIDRNQLPPGIYHFRINLITDTKKPFYKTGRVVII